MPKERGPKITNPGNARRNTCSDSKSADGSVA